MTVKSTFPLTPHFATLYFNKNPNLYDFLVNEGVHLLQVIKFSCIFLK
jgi:hypothetical protein